MKLMVFGASGGVGKHLATFAVAAGHDVTVVVRPSTPYDAPAGAVVLRTELLDAGAHSVLCRAVAGADVVMCSVGMKRTNPKNPWSKSVSPPDLTSALASRLVGCMKAEGVRRIVAVSAAGVGDSAPGLNLVMRVMLATTMIGAAYRDLGIMEQILADSGLDWLALRPTRLTDGPRTDRVSVVDRFAASASISRANVASFMLRALDEAVWPAQGWQTRTPQISEATFSER